MKYGIDVYTSPGTIEALKLNSHRAKHVEAGKKYSVGNFDVIPFDVKHDCPQPFGYMVRHKEMGVMVFLTDSFYSPRKFKDVNHFMVEVNYDPIILQENVNKGVIPAFVARRVMESHMSIDTCIDLLKANDLSKVVNIVLIHLSDSNSNPEDFKERVKKATGKNVIVARKNMKINFDQIPF